MLSDMKHVNKKQNSETKLDLRTDKNPFLSPYLIRPCLKIEAMILSTPNRLVKSLGGDVRFP